MTLTLEDQQGHSTSLLTPHDDVTMSELLELFEQLALGYGYHYESWKAAVLEAANQYRDKEDTQ